MKLPAGQIGTLSELRVTPERQFLNYAWPCLSNRAGHGQQVLPSHMSEITDLVARDVRPRRGLLRFVFPDAYRGIGLAALNLGVPRWSHAAVEQYFLIDHDNHLNAALGKGMPPRIVALCRVFVGKVSSIDPLMCDSLAIPGRRVTVLNPLLIPVQVGLAIAIHGLTVVDALRPFMLVEVS